MKSRVSSPRSALATSRHSRSFGASASKRSGHTGTRRMAKSSSSSCGSTLATAPERALDVALGVALGDVAALVALLLPPRERDLELRPAVLEVEAGRHQGEASLVDGADQGVD